MSRGFQAAIFFALVVIAIGGQIRAFSEHARAEDLSQQLNRMTNVNQRNRTTIMRQQCLIDGQSQFTHDLNMALAEGKFESLKYPDLGACMNLEAKPL